MSDHKRNDPGRTFRRRRAILAACLLAVIAACIALAITAQREASNRVKRLARVELEDEQLARDFRSAVDDLHGTLLRIGIGEEGDGPALVAQRRQALAAWLKDRQTSTLTDDERKIVQRIAVELQSYFFRLDAVVARQSSGVAPLDRETIVMFDDGAIRLQSLSDEFAAANNDEVADLLNASLASVLRMRDLIFACLLLVLIVAGVAMAMVYRDVIRPLREQLIDRETLLAKREKLAALGTLAAGVAHEIRNPLTAIKARLYTLRRALTTDETRADTRAITGEVERLERIVRDVLGYARPSDAVLAPVELSAWLREFGAFVQPTVTATNIELAVEAPVAIEVLADASQLRQVMLNLVRNAQEAFDAQPGRIELALGRERASLQGRPAEVALLTVTDNGPGIPIAVQPRLFDPFFTTKAAGTGLGLSIVARLVENQGGEIAFQSAPGRGTRFAVRLPLPPGAANTSGR